MRKVVPVVAVLLSACAAQSVPDPLPLPGEPGGPEPIELWADGLRPAPDLPVTRDTLSRAFTGYEVAGDDGATRFAVRYGGNTMVIVDVDGEGYRVKVRDPSVVGPAGTRIGSPFDSIASQAELQCRRGAGSSAIYVHCSTSSIDRITFVLKAPPELTPDCPENCAVPLLSSLAGLPLESIDYQ